MDIVLNQRVTNLETFLKFQKGELDGLGLEVKDILIQVNFIMKWISDNFGTISISKQSEKNVTSIESREINTHPNPITIPNEKESGDKIKTSHSEPFQETGNSLNQIPAEVEGTKVKEQLQANPKVLPISVTKSKQGFAVLNPGSKKRSNINNNKRIEIAKADSEISQSETKEINEDCIKDEKVVEMEKSSNLSREKHKRSKAAGQPKNQKEEKISTNTTKNGKGKTPMVCEECGKVLKGASSLKCHKQIHHSNVRPYICTDCGKAFKMKHHLDFHKLTHEGDKKWTCKFCDKGFIAERDLLRHERTHTGEKPYNCTFPNCSKNFNVKQHLTLHYRTHTGERPYKCTVCEKTFTQANSLRIHRKIHMKDLEQIHERKEIIGVVKTSEAIISSLP